jgi:hypothetical protein
MGCKTLILQHPLIRGQLIKTHKNAINIESLNSFLNNFLKQIINSPEQKAKIYLYTTWE